MSAKKTEILKMENVPYLSRIYSHIFDFGFVSLIFFGFITIYKGIYLGTSVIIGFILIYVFRRIFEAKYYLLEISRENDIISMRFCIKDEVRVEQFSAENLDVTFYNSAMGNFATARAIIYCKGKILLTQFNHGDWSRDKLNLFAKDLSYQIKKNKSPC